MIEKKGNYENSTGIIFEHCKKKRKQRHTYIYEKKCNFNNEDRSEL